jgi:glutamate dehydrogenase (NAD(P)+)
MGAPASDMVDVFDLTDDLGPAKVIHIYEPLLDLKAILVIDNVACGPAIGGVRMAPDVSLDECFRLARAMTRKNAAAGLPHGGGKSVIAADPKMPKADKERLVRAFGCAIGDIEDYIVGPDMGTDEVCMAWIKDEIGRSVGLPRELGGIPLDEIGATGFGLAAAAEVAQEFCDVKIKGARVAIQGFGAVGIHAARFLAEKGTVLVAASDSIGTIADADGLDIDALIAMKREGRSVADFGKGKAMDRDSIVGIDCDIWIPAARPDALRADNVDELRAKLVVQGANIPVTADAEQTLHERGILSIPDFIANAGGVICAAVEYRGGTETAAFEEIGERIRRNTREVLHLSADDAITPRAAADKLAGTRIRCAMSLRRWTSPNVARS